MELIATIIAVAPGHVRVHVPRAACLGCRGGCEGRCSPFSRPGETWDLASDSAIWQVGQQVRIGIEDRALRSLALRGYGAALAGLLLGALAGHALGLAWGRHGDALVAAGLVLGTLLALPASKRATPEPRLLGLADPPRGEEPGGSQE